MHTALIPTAEIALAAGVLGVLLAAIVPTCLYLYVEPRGRLSWGASGDAPRTRRAPVLIRFTAWLSFALGQFALPWLLVPVTCGALLYLQVQLGVGRPLGMAATVLVGVLALVESALAFRLIPLGVRLLAGDAGLGQRAARIASWTGIASGCVFGAGAFIQWAFAVPGLVHPWLRVALGWTALRPVIAYAAVCMLHALLLGRCARVLVDAPKRR
jgi:hypothetical protein